MRAKLFFAIFYLSCCAFNIFSQTDRGITVELKDEKGQKKNVELYTGSYALVIAASDYQVAGWNCLPGAKSDLPAVQAALEKQGFAVEEFAEPTSETLLPRLNKFVNDHGFIAGNRLLIYFTGHGYTETDAETGVQYGYIVPVDAPNPNKDLIGFQQRAVSMDEIESLAKRIRSRHALFIFDSCFSGTLISRDAGDTAKYIDYLTAKPVRQFITSGAANQTVPDKSVFRQAFVKGLEGDADGNKDGYITGSELAAYLQERVIFYSKKGQTPQYGKLRDPRLDGGDFVFLVPKLIEQSEKTAIEQKAWEEVRGSKNPNDFKQFLVKFPNGQYAFQARRQWERVWWEEELIGSQDQKRLELFLKEFETDKEANFAKTVQFTLSGIRKTLKDRSISSFGANDTLTGSFQGEVADSRSYAPISGVTVTFLKEEANVQSATRTDSEGRFYQGLLQPGFYEIRFIAEGYKEKVIRREVKVSLVGYIVPVPLPLEPLR